MPQKVNYTIEESESCLDNMIVQAISEFDKACDNIDSKHKLIQEAISPIPDLQERWNRLGH